ncbi:MAG: aminotransferase class IV [Bacteroidaceae bacterium]|nr:aminotransferase class IV [Bacteroidaceae bacterium]
MRYIESIKIVNGSLLRYAFHMQRIERTLGFPLSIPTTVPLSFQRGVVKYRLVYSAELGIEEVSYSFYTLPCIGSLQLVEAGNLDYHCKFEDRSSLQHFMTLRHYSDDILLLSNGMVSDTSYCNVVFENEQGLFTPRHSLLKGTQQAALLAQQIISYADISVFSISNYQRVHLINAMIELGELTLPVTHIAPIL